MRGSRILVVEDEWIVSEDIRVTLEDLGYEIVGGVVSSGEEAIRKAQEKKPDLALMDIVLAGEIDGMGAAQSIRDTWNVPVIYLTAYSERRSGPNASDRALRIFAKAFQGVRLALCHRDGPLQTPNGNAAQGERTEV